MSDKGEAIRAFFISSAGSELLDEFRDAERRATEEALHAGTADTMRRSAGQALGVRAVVQHIEKYMSREVE